MSTSEVEVVVLETLRSPHRFVRATREAMDGASTDGYGRLRIEPRAGIVRMLVSREQLHRSLRILQAVFAAAESCGYEIAPVEDVFHAYQAKPGVAIAVDEFLYPIEVSESTKQVSLSDDEIEKWKRDHHIRLSYGDESAPTTKSVPSGELEVAFPRSCTEQPGCG